jgi:GNAT superfamily N-acetyltransferase
VVRAAAPGVTRTRLESGMSYRGPVPATLIRAVGRADLPALLGLIRELAAYERAPDEVVATEAHLDAALFGDSPAAGAFVAEQAGQLVAMAVYFRTFSTWTGRPGLHLEDLFVTPPARGQGIGRQLLTALAGLATAEGLPRLEWAVLTWNEPAIGFYRRLGAEPLEEWRTWRLTGAALERLAAAEE